MERSYKAEQNCNLDQSAAERGRAAEPSEPAELGNSSSGMQLCFLKLAQPVSCSAWALTCIELIHNCWLMLRRNMTLTFQELRAKLLQGEKERDWRLLWCGVYKTFGL